MKKNRALIGLIAVNVVAAAFFAIRLFAQTGSSWNSTSNLPDPSQQPTANQQLWTNRRTLVTFGYRLACSSSGSTSCNSSGGSINLYWVQTTSPGSSSGPITIRVNGTPVQVSSQVIPVQWTNSTLANYP